MTAPHRYTLAELIDLPTLCVGQVDSLKIDNHDGVRVWLCRAGIEDGMEFDNLVTIERYDPETGRWEEAETYPAL